MTRRGWFLTAMGVSFFCGGLVGQTTSPHEIEYRTITVTNPAPPPEVQVQTVTGQVDVPTVPESCSEALDLAFRAVSNAETTDAATSRVLDLISQARVEMAAQSFSGLQKVEERTRKLQSHTSGNIAHLVQISMDFNAAAHQCERDSK